MINVAIIPARGGSKRIPKKNIRDFSGHPIIAYSIKSALNSGCFDKVIVSTDDQNIADIASSYGAEVPFLRPKALADDYVGTTEVIVDAISQLTELGYQLNYVCCIYATAPFLQAHYLKQGLDELKKAKNKTFSFSVCKFNYPVQRSFTIAKESNTVLPISPECLPMRSQDLPDVYHDAGQFYWSKAESFDKPNQGAFSPLSIPIVLPSYLVQDIDDEQDWKRAELMYNALQASYD